MASTEANIAVAINDIRTIKSDINEIKEDFKQFRSQYITREEFAPIKSLVYGMTAIILSAVIIAIVALVIGGKIL